MKMKMNFRKNQKGFGDFSFFVFVGIFAVIGAMFLIRGLAAGNKVSFSLPGNGSRYAPLTGSIYTNHWSWACDSSPTAKYEAQIFNSSGKKIYDSSFTTGPTIDTRVPANNSFAHFMNLSNQPMSCTASWSAR